MRELAPSRPEQYAFLNEHGYGADLAAKTYSVNRGIWGTTIGGGDLHDPSKAVPDDCWPDTTDPDEAPAEGTEVLIAFKNGVPVTLDGNRFDGVTLLGELAPLAAAHGIGRGIHTGDTILGIKGRLAFEAPAAAVLLFAHRNFCRA